MFLGALYRPLNDHAADFFRWARLIHLQKIIMNNKGHVLFWKTDVSGDVFLCETNKRVKSTVVLEEEARKIYSDSLKIHLNCKALNPIG